jgi:hypothetical protein
MCCLLRTKRNEQLNFFLSDFGGRNFLTCRAGFETLHSTCRPCNNNVCQSLRTTEEGFVNSLLLSYKKHGLTVPWFYEKLKEQQGVGPISGVKLKLTLGEINSIGIHAYNNDKDHTPYNCFLEIQELNVCQHEAIPCLFCS